MTTSLSISCLRGLLVFFSAEDRFAIYPKVVASPIRTTTPFPDPSLHNVPKKAKLAVSNGLSGCEHTVVLSKGSDSPVKGELSTFISALASILISAGIFSPAFTFTISPQTSFKARIIYGFPFLITVQF